jgi:hypothetical protein
MNSSMVEHWLVKPKVERSNLSSSAICLLMSEFDDEETVISQYSSQTNGALAEMVLLHSVENGNIVVQFHGAPQLN